MAGCRGQQARTWSARAPLLGPAPPSAGRLCWAPPAGRVANCSSSPGRGVRAAPASARPACRLPRRGRAQRQRAQRLRPQRPLLLDQLLPRGLLVLLLLAPLALVLVAEVAELAVGAGEAALGVHEGAGLAAAVPVAHGAERGHVGRAERRHAHRLGEPDDHRGLLAGEHRGRRTHDLIPHDGRPGGRRRGQSHGHELDELGGALLERAGRRRLRLRCPLPHLRGERRLQRLVRGLAAQLLHVRHMRPWLGSNGAGRARVDLTSLQEAVELERSRPVRRARQEGVLDDEGQVAPHVHVHTGRGGRSLARQRGDVEGLEDRQRILEVQGQIVERRGGLAARGAPGGGGGAPGLAAGLLRGQAPLGGEEVQEDAVREGALGGLDQLGRSHGWSDEE
mmetsp:Transcript_27411/g.60244  ORF Transcript_27411/g.60244 Transcript_27411/m.60244 type:complete len:394 (+) Transcript_27411:16-1197(+)